MLNMNFSVKYEGEQADNHILPALEGAISIEGIARSVTMITHYLGSGKVRRKAPFESDIQVYLRPVRAGSLDTIYQITSSAEFVAGAGGLALGLTTNLIYDLIKVTFSRVIGNSADPETKELSQLEEAKAGDISALEDAIEPALIQAHRVIGQGSRNIVIFGDHNRIVLDSDTKSYINSSILESHLNNKRVSVASYNANDRTGRVFDFEFHKTIPFKVDRDAETDTAVAIASSLTRYAARRDSNLEITFQRVLAPDGRLKKYIIHRATLAGSE